MASRGIRLFMAFVLCGLNSYAQEEEQKVDFNEPPSIDVLFKESKHSVFTISPDGRYFTEVLETDTGSDIIIVDIDGYALHKRIPVEYTKVSKIYWLTDKRILYEASGEIYAVNIDGSSKLQIVGKWAENTGRHRFFLSRLRYNKVISLLPELENEILVQTLDINLYATVKRVNIYTGAEITVLSGKRHKVIDWIYDLDGEPRLGIRIEKDIIEYVVKNPKSREWVPLFVTIQGKTTPVQIDPSSYLDQKVLFEGFGDKKNIVYLTTTIDSDRRKLIAYDLLEHKVVETILEDNINDIQDPLDDRMGLYFDQNGLAGVRYEGVVPQFKWFSDHLREQHYKLNNLYPGFIHDIMDMDAQQKRLVILQWSDRNAGNVGIYDVDTESYAVMFHFNEELNAYDLSPIKNVVATARDDYKLSCYLNLPNAISEDEEVPLIVIPHGGPWARDYWELDPIVQYFTSRGYATLKVNFRGSTGFGKAHVLAGVQSMDEVMINDITDATHFIRDKYNIIENQVYLYGHSYGGYATYMGLLKYPETFSAGVAVSAPSDIKKWLKTQKKEKNTFAYEFWNTALGSDKSKYLAKISPITHAAYMDKPLLIFHGKRDNTIPVEQAEIMINELKRHQKDAKLEVFKDEGHSFSSGLRLGYILDAADKFFKRAENMKK